MSHDNTGQVNDDDGVIHVYFSACSEMFKKSEEERKISIYIYIFCYQKHWIEIHWVNIYILIAEYKYFRRRKTVTLRILASYWIKKNQTYENNETWSSRSSI